MCRQGLLVGSAWSDVRIPPSTTERPTTNADLLFSSLCSLISLAFAVLVGRRCLSRRQPALLLWTIGLVWYAVSTGAQALGAAYGWSVPLYRIWYLTGAFYTAAFLGMGSIYLVAPRPVAHGVMVWLALGSLAVAPLALLAPVDPALLPLAEETPTGAALHEAVRKVTPLYNVFGAAGLFFGAAWGALNFWVAGRSQRAVANLLIALGAVVPSFASGLTRFGITLTLAPGQLIGVLFILAGFLLAMRAPANTGQQQAEPADPAPAPVPQRFSAS